MVARTESSPTCSMKPQLSQGLDEKLKSYYYVSSATFSMCLFKAISIPQRKGHCQLTWGLGCLLDAVSKPKSLKSPIYCLMTSITQSQTDK